MNEKQENIASLVSCPKEFEIRFLEGKGRALFAKESLAAGKRLFECSGSLTDILNISSMCLQVGENLFLNGIGGFDDYMNHSCDPNCILRFEGDVVTVYAMRQIASGEELTFDYNTSEWDMLEQERISGEATVFDCFCESELCVGLIRGFKYLTDGQRLRIKDKLSPFLREKSRL